MALRGYDYTLPVATPPAGTTTAGIELTATAAATYTQLGTWEQLRCGSIAFDESTQLPESLWSVQHRVVVVLEIPSNHRVAIQLWDQENSKSLGEAYYVSYLYYWYPGLPYLPETRFAYLTIDTAFNAVGNNWKIYSTGFLPANLPSGDAKLMFRYYCDKTADGSSFSTGSSSGYYHGAYWTVERS